MRKQTIRLAGGPHDGKFVDSPHEMIESIKVAGGEYGRPKILTTEGLDIDLNGHLVLHFVPSESVKPEPTFEKVYLLGGPRDSEKLTYVLTTVNEISIPNTECRFDTYKRSDYRYGKTATDTIPVFEYVKPKPELPKPKFKVGDKVTIERCSLVGTVSVVFGEVDGPWRYDLESESGRILGAGIDESCLSLYVPPVKRPKFAPGDKVTHPDYPSVFTVGNVRWDMDEACYFIKCGLVTIGGVKEERLKPCVQPQPA